MTTCALLLNRDLYSLKKILKIELQQILKYTESKRQNCQS